MCSPFSRRCHPLVVGAAGRDFFAVFVPGVDPAALSAGEGVASGSQDFAHIALGEGVQFFALGSTGVVPSALLEDVERLGIGNDLALAGAEGVDLLAVFVIDVVPRAFGLDVTDFLGIQACDGHEHDEGKKNPFHNDMSLFDEVCEHCKGIKSFARYTQMMLKLSF